MAKWKDVFNEIRPGDMVKIIKTGCRGDNNINDKHCCENYNFVNSILKVIWYDERIQKFQIQNKNGRPGCFFPKDCLEKVSQ